MYRRDRQWASGATCRSTYLIRTEDKSIPPATQRFMAARTQATIEEVPSSHASMVSQPDVVTLLIPTAVEATSRTAAARG